MANDELRREIAILLAPNTGAGEHREAAELSRILLPVTAGDRLASTSEEVLGLIGDRGATSAGDGRSIPGAPEALTALVDELAGLGRRIGELTEASRRQVQSLDQNSRATLESALGRGRWGTLLGELGGKSPLSVLGSGLSPVLRGIAGLFLGRRSTPEPPLSLFSAPSSLQVQAALPGQEQPGIAPLRYDSEGLPQRVTPREPAPAAPQISIQVNAIDSRSFLDHSDQIARAVRDAMLSTNSLADVVRDF